MTTSAVCRPLVIACWLAAVTAPAWWPVRPAGKGISPWAIAALAAVSLATSPAGTC